MALYGALFSVPIFAGSILHYTSQQVGLLLLPGALASAFTMPIAARLSRSMDARLMLAMGALVLVTALFLLGGLSPLTSDDDLFVPLLVRAFGTVMMFLPLQLAAIGPIPRKDVAAATGFFNLTRQLGGSVGVALLSTMLEKREAFHRAVLVEKLNATSALTLDRAAAYTQLMLSKGFDLDTARAKALALLDGIVNVQSAVLSFGDTFRATALLVVLTLPLVLLLGRPPRGATVSAGH